MPEEIIELVRATRVEKDINDGDIRNWKEISEKSNGSSFFIPSRNLLIFNGREIII